MSQFSVDDMSQLEKMVRQNFEESIMVSSLGKLQHANVMMTEKLNNIFAESARYQSIKRRESQDVKK
jgi:hypothetical protein